MNDISSITPPNHTPLNGAQKNGHHHAPVQEGPNRGADRVELSSQAQAASKANQASQIRHDLVDRVRSEIQAGTYETPEKVDAAISALSQDLV